MGGTSSLDGNVTCGNICTTTEFVADSDCTLKQNIKSIAPSTARCLQETVNSPTTCDQTGTSEASQGWEGDVGERDFELDLGGAS